MSPVKWAAQFNEVDFSKFPFRIQAHAVATPDGGVHMRAEMNVVSVVAGGPLRVFFDEVIPAMGLSYVKPHDAFRRIVLAVIGHEVDECIFIRGIQPFDPHRNETKPVGLIPGREAQQ